MKDTIYRDDAIKCCRNEWEEEVEERLRLLPSADVQPVVRGEWIEPNNVLTFLCSNCGYINNSVNRFNFCPNCGARMVEE